MTDSLKEKLLMALLAIVISISSWALIKVIGTSEELATEIERSKIKDDNQHLWLLSQSRDIKILQKDVSKVESKVETIHRSGN